MITLQNFVIFCQTSTFISHQLNSVQSLSSVRLFATPWITTCQASLSITSSWSLLKLTSIKSIMPPNHLILCRPLLLLPTIPPSNRVFSNESTLPMRWPKYWSFSFSIISSKEIPGLIFRMDWLDLLAVQGTLKSLLQHHSSWQIDGETVETVADFILEGLQNHCRWWLQPWNEKTLTPWKKSYDQPR